MDPRIKKTNPQERGFQLPIGVLQGGKLVRDFSLRELSFDIERDVGKFRRQNSERPGTAQVGKLLALLIDSLAGQPMEHVPGDPKAKEEDTILKVGRLYLADVYYIYVMARIQEIGHEYKSKFMCFNCGYKGEMVSDLRTMDVYAVEDVSVLQKKVTLFKGLKYRDGTVKKSVTISPMLWVNMESKDAAEAAADEMLMKLHFVSRCITGVEGIDSPVALTPAELGSIRKIDIEIISKEINDMNIGPRLVADGNCPKCNGAFSWPMDWDYPSFFGISSP